MSEGSAPNGAAAPAPAAEPGKPAAADPQALRDKLVTKLKKKTTAREKAKAKGAPEPGKPKPKAPPTQGKPAAKGKAEPEPGGKPKRGAAPEAEPDDAEDEKPKGKAKGKGKTEPEDPIAAKRAAAKRALDAEKKGGATLEAAAGADDEADEDDEDDDEDTETEAAEKDDDEADDRKLTRERRDFAKFRRKKEAEYETRDRDLQGREGQIRQLETQFGEQLATYKKDPLAWLKARGVNVRETLIAFANEDGEDPKDKKLRELEDTTKSLKEKLDTEEETKANERAKEQIRVGLQRNFNETDGEDYPNLWTHSDPESVSRAALIVALDHYRAHGQKLAPAEVFDILEEKLIAHNARKAREAKLKGKPRATEDRHSEPPEQVRSVRGNREPVSPEARRSPRRPSEDVTNRETRLSRDDYRGRASFDREAAREKAIDMVRERLRD